MSELVESVSSSASSVIAKTTVIGGAGVGAPAAIPFMQSHGLWVFNYAEICQLLATFYILWQLYHAIKIKIDARKKSTKKPEASKPSIMGGSPGGGPEEETEKDD